MTTQLFRPVKRELTHTTVDFGKHRGRKLTVTLQPGDVLEFQIKGTRRILEVPLKNCYMLAEILTNESDYKDRLAEYRMKQKAGLKRLRKPRKAQYPYSKVFYKALSS